MEQIQDTRSFRRGTISYPWGAPDMQTPDFIAALEVDLLNNMTFITPGLMTADMTVTAVLDPELQAGSRVTFTVTADGTGWDFIPSTGFSNTTAITVAATTTRVVTYEYNGTTLLLISNELG